MALPILWFPGVSVRLGLLVVASVLCRPGGAGFAEEQAAKAEVITKGPAVGDALPELEAVDEQGNAWKSTGRAGKGPLVIYFYPGDFTGGCIKQAQKFQELVEKFREAGAEVVGVSGDDVATHKLFKETFKLPQTLLADPNGKLASSLGVPVAAGQKVRTRGADGKALMDERGKSVIITRPATLARWTFIIGSDGKVLACRENVDPLRDAEEVLKLVLDAK
ncbi:MAG: peroxiredoxin [Pirellulaceae bacterium]